MISIDRNKCTGCSICAHVCPHGLIEMNDGTAFLTDADKCITCGACGINCPAGAVDVDKKTGCVVTIIKEDILKLKKSNSGCQEDVCAPRNISPEKAHKKVLLFVPQGFEDLEVATFTDIIGWTRVLKEVKSVDLVITAFRRSVRSKHNLIINVHALLDEVKVSDYHALIIPGGFNDSGYQEVYDERVLDLIRKVYANGGIITAMCVGSLAVAKAGILRDREATTYSLSRRHDNLQTLRDYGAITSSQRIVISDRIITNRGPDTSIDVAFKLVEMLNGEEDMMRIRKALMFE
ncbi:MAG: DJ-1/PfpI family protein [Nitrospirota bacterium]